MPSPLVRSAGASRGTNSRASASGRARARVVHAATSSSRIISVERGNVRLLERAQHEPVRTDRDVRKGRSHAPLHTGRGSGDRSAEYGCGGPTVGSRLTAAEARARSRRLQQCTACSIDRAPRSVSHPIRGVSDAGYRQVDTGTADSGARARRRGSTERRDDPAVRASPRRTPSPAVESSSRDEFPDPGVVPVPVLDGGEAGEGGCPSPPPRSGASLAGPRRLPARASDRSEEPESPPGPGRPPGPRHPAHAPAVICIPASVTCADTAERSRTTTSARSSERSCVVAKATVRMPAARPAASPAGASSKTTQRAGSTPSFSRGEQERLRVRLAPA